MKNDPASIKAQAKLEEEIEALIGGLSNSSMMLIAERFGSITEDYTVAMVYRDLINDYEKFEKLISKGKNKIKEWIANSYKQAALANDEWAKRFYDAMGVQQVASLDNEAIFGIVTGSIKEAEKFIDKYVNTSVIGFVDGKKRFKSWETFYRDTVSEAVNSMLAGDATYQTAISNSVRQMASSGLREGFYARGVQYASGNTRELYGAVRTNVMDNYRQMLSQARFIQGQEYGADGVEVSAHSPCAPDHLPYQGNVYSYEQLNRIMASDQALQRRPLETGANCQHMFSHVLVDIAKKTKAYSDSEIAEMNRQSNEIVEITGLSGKQLSMTRYEASQYQRSVEQRLRTLKTDKVLNEAAKLDVTNYNKAIKKTSAAYRNLCEEAGLTTRPERTRPYVMV